MDYTLHIGSWIIPLLLNVLAFGIAWKMSEESQDCTSCHFSIPDFFTFGYNLFLYAIATIASLVFWLVWALLT